MGQQHEGLWSILQQYSLFRGVSPEAVEHLFEHFAERSIAEGEVVLRPREENNFLFLLLEGEVQVCLDSPEQLPHQLLGPGECFGEMSLVDSGQTSAYVVATSNCRCLLIDEKTLWELINISHGVARNLLFIMARRMRHDNDTIVQNLDQLQQWESFALSDALTGFNNRRWLDESIERIIKRSQFERQALSAVILDVDHFKAFNDRWGHLAGDQALRTLAHSIHDHLRVGDLVARYGGEEFLILLPLTPLEQALEVAERLRLAISATHCGQQGDKVLPAITVSMGLTALQEDDDSESLLERADKALYKAKQLGRDRVVGE